MLFMGICYCNRLTIGEGVHFSDKSFNINKIHKNSVLHTLNEKSLQIKTSVLIQWKSFGFRGFPLFLEQNCDSG